MGMIPQLELVEIFHLNCVMLERMAVYTNSDGGNCRITNIQIISGLN